MQQPKLNASSRIMYEEATRRGIKCTTFGDHETILMQQGEQQWYTRGSRTSIHSSIGRTIANQKSLTKKILKHFNLPTANYVEIKAEEQLNKIKMLNFPLVMKPVSGAHGRDVIVGIKNYDQACDQFKKYGKKVIFEEMLQGTEYRIICVDFKFVAAAFRKPAFVEGDGKKTITELVAEKNKHPWRKDGHEGNLTKIKIDETVIANLKELNLTAQSIPPKGETIYLRKTANLSTGGEAWDVTATVCKENKQLFEKIAKACDLNTIGIDIMCQSLETPIIEQQKTGVIEVNGSPGLRMHHFPLKGKQINVAGKILDMVISKI